MLWLLGNILEGIDTRIAAVASNIECAMITKYLEREHYSLNFAFPQNLHVRHISMNQVTVR